MVKDTIIKEWFEKARKDLDSAEFLLENNQSLEIVAFHIQQSAEKYLKGFLIAHGRELVKIHDLIRLLEDAVKIDKDFKIFINPFQKITDFYFESRYPVGYEVEYTKEELQSAINDVKSLIEMIKEKVKI